MKRIITPLLCLALCIALGLSVYASLPENELPTLTNSISVADEEIVSEDETQVTPETSPTPLTSEVPTSFDSLKDEIYYKMLNSIDYFSTAKVSFSALFPGFDAEQNYTIETNIDTGVSHQTCSDNFIQTYSATDTAEAYETYSDGNVIREYNNLDRTFYTVSSIQERCSATEEWGTSDRYYVDENGNPHYRYRSNPTNADMAGECLFPQVSAFAYLTDKNLWTVGENVNYCNRECYAISGSVNESYAAQIGAETFMMYVDRETGILLKLCAYDATGTPVSTMTVSEIQIDAPVAYSATAYDMQKYEGYKELTN